MILLINLNLYFRKMKEITLKIPDEKVPFFLQLVNELGLELSEETPIPEEHKAIVRERMKSSEEKDFITWEEARKILSHSKKS